MATDFYDFYSDQTITPLTASPVAFNWPFRAETFILINDDTAGSNTIVYGFAGPGGVAGKIKPGESVVLDESQFQGVYLNYQGGVPAYRLMIDGK